MTIAVISRSDASGGGAGRVADELCAGLRSSGQHVLRVYRKGDRPTDSDTVLLPALRGEQGLRQLAGVDLATLPLAKLLKERGVTLAHFHDTHMAFGLRSAQRAAAVMPVCFTFHDYTGFTGGCMYPAGCVRFDVGCGQCPETGVNAQPVRIDLSASTWDANRRFAETPGVAAISPSAHFAALAERGAWHGRRVEVIPNGADIETFHPSHRRPARAAESVEKDHRILLFVAAQVGDPRKGLADLLPQLRPRFEQDPSLQLWVVGGEPERVSGLDAFGDRVRRFGSVRDKNRLAAIYAAADLFLLPSREDNLPCTAVEALACGTPVVGRPVGGIPEIFEDGISGTLAATMKPDALGWAIDRALATLARDEGRAAARLRATSRFSLQRFVTAHTRLYEGLLSARRFA